jgi:ribosomal protein S27E
MSGEPEQISVVTSDGVLGRDELDQLLKAAPEGAAATLGCPICQRTKLNVAYSNGILVVACPACKRQLALVVVAGSERHVMAQVLKKLDTLVERLP